LAKLYVAEFAHLPLDDRGRPVMAPPMPPIAEQVVAIGMTSTQAANVFQSNTRYAQIHTDAICSVAFGTNPTATASNQRLAANETRFTGVNPGDLIAVIVNT
jgi:hypothetical protein